MSPRRSRPAGFTTIELMIVVAITAVLIASAAPSFVDFLSKRRVDGVMAELVTDLHYARSEAVSRNATVRITFGPRCYVIHLAGTTSAECDAGTATPTKTVRRMERVGMGSKRETSGGGRRHSGGARSERQGGMAPAERTTAGARSTREAHAREVAR